MRLPEPSATAWVDGRPVPLAEAAVEIADPAFQSGLGLFETIAVRGGVLYELDAHLERLGQAGRRIDVPLPAGLAEGAREMARRERNPCAWLKIIATRSRCLIFTGAMDPAEEGRPVTAVLLRGRRNPHDPLSGLKTLNYAASVLGIEEARRRGADEGIWLNTRGHLTEACSSNLFVVRRRKLFTAAVRDGILPGVVRDLTLLAARELRIIVHEGKVRLRRLETADEVFLTSSLRGLRPVVRYEGAPVGRGQPGPLTLHLTEAVAARRVPSDG